MKEMEYADYKTVIEVIGADGERKVEFTTWRSDILTAMVRAGLAAGAETQIFKPGDVFTVRAAPNRLKDVRENNLKLCV